MVDKKQSLFWSLTHQETKPLLLLGTIHVRDSQILKWIEKLVSYWCEMDSLALELNLSENCFRPVVPISQKLSEFIPKKKYQKLRKIFLKSFQLDIAQFDHIHPLFISQVTAETFFDQTLDPTVDFFLWQIAQEKEMNLHGLETWDQQIKVLDLIPYKVQVKQLIDLSRNIGKVSQQIPKLKEYYSDQDIRSLYQAAKRQLGVMRKIMLYDRNILLAQRIFEINQDESLLAGIGAAHLWGEKGVLRLLKKKGYRLKPIFVPIE